MVEETRLRGVEEGELLVLLVPLVDEPLIWWRLLEWA